jgi:hypothetical protein
MSAQIHKMHNSTRHSGSGAQSGQAIVLIALAMVALLGMAGLALDGGSLLFLQRKAQTVAEMAAMSAAVKACQNGGASENAILSEVERVAALDGNNVDSSKIEAAVHRNGEATDVEVTIRLPKPPYFIQVVYKGELIAEGHSVARCSTTASIGGGPYADSVLFATSETCPDSFDLDGTSMDFTGSVTSNNNMSIDPGGSGGRITGTANFVGGADGLATIDQWPVPAHVEGFPNTSVAGYGPPNWSDPHDDSGEGLRQIPVQPAPLLYEIDDFRPGGEVWESLPENRRRELPADVHWKWPGTCATPDWCDDQMPTWNGKVQGLYFIDGDFSLTGGGNLSDGFMNAINGDGITIVATGRVEVTGPPFVIMPYYDNLQIMSGAGAVGGYSSVDAGTSITTGGSCDLEAIRLPQGSFGHLSASLSFGTAARPALIYAPWGQVAIGTTNAGPAYGQIVAYTIDMDFNTANIYHVPAIKGVSGSTAPLDVYYLR